MVNDIRQREDGRWVKPCPECGVEQDYLRKNYARLSLELNKTCKSCSNRKTENNNRGLYEETVRLSWFTKFQTNAETRGLTFEITIEDVYFLYTAQEGKCALSGLPIGWAEVGQLHTASIDRIDSTKGYLVENCQLVHKDINMIKQSYEQSYHDLFADIYEDVYGSIDPTAENIRKLDEYAPFKLDTLMKLASIEDSKVPTNPRAMAKDLMKANEKVINKIKSTFDTAIKENEQAIANFLADRLDMHQKWAWQLKASTK